VNCSRTIGTAWCTWRRSRSPLKVPTCSTFRSPDRPRRKA
jgi:hypothetical protein